MSAIALERGREDDEREKSVGDRRQRGEHEGLDDRANVEAVDPNGVEAFLASLSFFVLGLDFGLDLLRPALKLPLVGRVGMRAAPLRSSLSSSR